MKILILSKKFPYPLREGEPIAITYLSRSLVERGCEVSILVMNTAKHFFDPQNLPEEYDHFSKIYSVPVDNRITIKGAFNSLISGQSYILDRFVSDDYEEKLVQVLKKEKYDVVQIETPYLSHYTPTIRRHSRAIISMRAHNVEHRIWEKVASMTKNPLKKWYLKNQNQKLKKFEIEKLEQYDVMLAITEKDLNEFRQLGFNNEAVSAPVGIDLSEYIPNGFDKKISLAFIGALDWMPNQDGLLWFIKNVFPKIIQQYEELEFHIAGKNTPDWLKKYASNNIIFHGEVPDAKSFINAHPILVAPLFSGSGIKIKVLEGMALKRVVVTTDVGVEGISAEHKKEILIGNSIDEFQKNIINCMKGKYPINEIGHSARLFVQREFDNLEIADRVIHIYQKKMTEE